MFRTLLILLIIAPVVFFAAGFRIHPENLPPYFQGEPGKMVRLDLTTGRTAVGELVTKNESMIILKIAGSDAHFSPMNILEMRDLTPGEIEQARKSGLVTEKKKKEPLWSHDRERAFF